MLVQFQPPAPKERGHSIPLTLTSASIRIVTDDDREKLRQECHADLTALRGDPGVSERAFRLLEKLVVRLDRIETGSFHPLEAPTEPERRTSSQKWSNEGVLRALEEGRRKDEE